VQTSPCAPEHGGACESTHHDRPQNLPRLAMIVTNHWAHARADTLDRLKERLALEPGVYVFPVCSSVSTYYSG